GRLRYEQTLGSLSKISSEASVKNERNSSRFSVMPISYHKGSRDSLDETPRVVQNLPMDARNHHALANKRKISAVIFDYGEVLCCPPSLEHLARMAEVFHMRGEEFFPAYI